MKTAEFQPAPVERPLSAEIRDILAKLGETPVTVAQLLDLAGGRGYDLVLILVALPFATPVPLPGLSLPFGLLIFLIGLRKIADGPLWVPRSVLARTLTPAQVRRIAVPAARIVGWFERFSRPRFPGLTGSAPVRRIEAVLITIAGFFMLLPIPVPFSNGIPACTVILLAAGSIGRDGLFFLLGCLGIVVNAGFVGFLALEGWRAADLLWQYFWPR